MSQANAPGIQRRTELGLISDTVQRILDDDDGQFEVAIGIPVTVNNIDLVCDLNDLATATDAKLLERARKLRDRLRALVQKRAEQLVEAARDD